MASPSSKGSLIFEHASSRSRAAILLVLVTSMKSNVKRGLSDTAPGLPPKAAAIPTSAPTPPPSATRARLLPTDCASRWFRDTETGVCSCLPSGESGFSGRRPSAPSATNTNTWHPSVSCRPLVSSAQRADAVSYTCRRSTAMGCAASLPKTVSICAVSSCSVGSVGKAYSKLQVRPCTSPAAITLNTMVGALPPRADHQEGKGGPGCGGGSVERARWGASCRHTGEGGREEGGKRMRTDYNFFPQRR